MMSFGHLGTTVQKLGGTFHYFFAKDCCANSLDLSVPFRPFDALLLKEVIVQGKKNFLDILSPISCHVYL